MSESKIYTEELRQRSMRDRVENRRIQTSKEKFEGYDSNKWEHTYFNEETGGYVVTEIDRLKERDSGEIKQGEIESQTQKDYKKEYDVARRFASWGFQIEHLADRKQKGGNPDVRLRRVPNIRINGELADIKTITVVGKVYRRGNEVFDKNGAQKALLRFTFSREEKGWQKRLKSLSDEGKHGYYYFEGENKYYEF